MSPIRVLMLLGGLLFLLAPMKSFAPVLGHLQGVFTALPLIFFLLALFRARPAAEAPASRFSRAWPLSLLLLLAIGIRVYWSATHHPWEWDEHGHLDLLVRMPGEALNPFGHTENHVLGSLTAWASIKLLGLGKFASRLPGMIFGLLFLGGLIAFYRRYCDRLSLFLILGHIALNAFVIWYLHSMRGYVSMMLSGLICFAVVFEMLQAKRLTRGMELLFAVNLLCAPFLHTFAMFYAGILGLSLIVWMLYFEEYRESVWIGKPWRILRAKCTDEPRLQDPPLCIEVRGDENIRNYTRLYFPEQATECESRFTVIIAQNPHQFLKEEKFQMPESPQGMSLWYADGKGRYLFGEPHSGTGYARSAAGKTRPL